MRIGERVINLPPRRFLDKNPPFGGSIGLPFLLCEHNHGSSQEEGLQVAARYATEPPCVEDRGVAGMPQLRRAEAPASRVRFLRPLRQARSRRQRGVQRGLTAAPAIVRPGRSEHSERQSGDFLDAMGGDNAPEMVVRGADIARRRFPQCRFLFFGDEAKVRPLLDSSPELKKVSTLRHTVSVVTDGRQAGSGLAVRPRQLHASCNRRRA